MLYSSRFRSGLSKRGRTLSTSSFSSTWVILPSARARSTAPSRELAGDCFPGRAVHALVAVEHDGRLHLLPGRGVQHGLFQMIPHYEDEVEGVRPLVRVPVTPGVHLRLTPSPGHLRAPEQGPLPASIVQAQAVGVAGYQGQLTVRYVHARPALDGPLRRTRSALHMAAGQPVGPASGRSRQMDWHLKEFEALAEVDLHPRWSRGSSRYRVSVHRTVERPSHPSERTRARKGPSPPRPIRRFVERFLRVQRNGRCGRSRCRSCPGADAGRCRSPQQVLSSDAQTADPGAVQLRPQVAVGDEPGRGFQIRCRRFGGGVRLFSPAPGRTAFLRGAGKTALYVGGCVRLHRLKTLWAVL